MVSLAVGMFYDPDGDRRFYGVERVMQWNGHTIIFTTCLVGWVHGKKRPAERTADPLQLEERTNRKRSSKTDRLLVYTGGGLTYYLLVRRVVQSNDNIKGTVHARWVRCFGVGVSLVVKN